MVVTSRHSGCYAEIASIIVTARKEMWDLKNKECLFLVTLRLR